MPAFGWPSGTCIFSRNSISQRASSRMSGTLFFFSGMFILPSAKSAGRAARHGALVLVHQRPDGDAAVDDVLALVTGVVPAAADVQLVGAAGAGHAGDLLVALVGRHLHVTGGARPLLAARVRHRDRDPAARLVEVGERVVLQLVQHVGADVERVARVGAHLQRVVLAGRLHRREIDDLHVVARRRVLADRLGLAARRPGRRPCGAAPISAAPSGWSSPSPAWAAPASSRSG